jgi:hypothetical protein
MTTTIRGGDQGSVRIVGAVVAAGISLFVGAVPGDLVLGSLTIDLRGLGLAGAPLAAALGLSLAPAVAGGSWRMALGVGIEMGAAAAYLGVVELGLIAVIAALLGFDPSTGFSNDVSGALFIAVVGLPFGTLVLPITIPCGVAWALVVRSVAAIDG